MECDLVAIVLAAGQGTRMKSDLPKVLHPVSGRPMLDHVLDAVEQAGAKKIIVIVGHGGEEVAQHVGQRAQCLTQHEQLGTAHAVLQAKEALDGFKGKALIVCGDTPLLRAETLRESCLARSHGSQEREHAGVRLLEQASDGLGFLLATDEQPQLGRQVGLQETRGLDLRERSFAGFEAGRDEVSHLCLERGGEGCGRGRAVGRGLGHCRQAEPREGWGDLWV